MNGLSSVTNPGIYTGRLPVEGGPEDLAAADREAERRFEALPLVEKEAAFGLAHQKAPGCSAEVQAARSIIDAIKAEANKLPGVAEARAALDSLREQKEHAEKAKAAAETTAANLNDIIRRHLAACEIRAADALEPKRDEAITTAGRMQRRLEDLAGLITDAEKHWKAVHGPGVERLKREAWDKAAAAVTAHSEAEAKLLAEYNRAKFKLDFNALIRNRVILSMLKKWA